MQLKKRREDAYALPKLRETNKPLEISHEVLSECDTSPHRFRSLSIIYSARVDN